MKILIAEDERVSSLRLRKALEKLGHEVTVADDGEEAWRIVRDQGARLVISDWMMPRMDGLELCRKIRAQSDAMYTYIILLTSRESREDRVGGLQAGADDFLVKPFDMGELVARLNVARRILAMQEELHAHSRALREMHDALERQNVLLAEMAVTDPLTGLKNRRHFFETLGLALSSARRDGRPVSAVMLDVDRFKSYNDEFGHPAGDEVLRMTADVLRSGVRRHDLVARYGGEEFVILLPSTEAEPAREVTERLRESFAARNWPLSPITASFGVATTADGLATGPALIDMADKALYRSKQAGRDRVTHHDDLTPPEPETSPAGLAPDWLAKARTS